MIKKKLKKVKIQKIMLQAHIESADILWCFLETREYLLHDHAIWSKTPFSKAS
jgi:hypothetical protein